MNSKIIDDALGFVKQVFSTDFSGHDAHTLRVYKIAVNCARKGAKSRVFALAALYDDQLSQRRMTEPLRFYASMLTLTGVQAIYHN